MVAFLITILGEENIKTKHEVIGKRFEKLEGGMKDMDQYIMNKAGRVAFYSRIWI
jgi:DNA polymerase III gamma/tau subunit